ncbi:hypothetical protein NUW58_g2843 [Xylaria curta]|uniref:Uncharacterized protein n=1 Tax=Xylaria curta TaxID=42375 RepID=A0ACC1PGC4_9PEZI|nr:hypothetical protein NUW58_g2843 [Xylaria curta]
MKPNTLPPGPKGVPLFGNIMDLPPKGKREWEHWLIHKDIYGPISSVTALGTTIVILHSAELALELLEKRSLIYSARPNFVFADLVGWSKSLAMLQYNKTHRLYRKLAHTMIGTQAAVFPYLALLEKEVHRFLFRVLKEPELLFHHMKTESGAIILKIVYGYTVEPHKPDPLVQLADKAMIQFAASTVPGSWMVDIIPSLKYIPEWMPGTGWKKTMKEWRATLEETAEKPLQFAQHRIANGDPVKSFVADFHNNKGGNHTPEDHEALKWTALTMYGGGSDTTVSTLMSFFLTMILFPDVQSKAQEEIDRVIGTTRLPTFRDRESLPYVDAVVKEAWRWHPVTPMGVPHATAAEDVVNGYRIPKGAIVMTNIWWFTHDPAVYPDPLGQSLGS